MERKKGYVKEDLKVFADLQTLQCLQTAKLIL